MSSFFIGVAAETTNTSGSRANIPRCQQSIVRGSVGLRLFFFRDHILARRRARERLDVRSQGLEDVLTNDCCIF